MSSKTIEQMVDELLHLYEEKRRSPFPRTGCRKILRGSGDRYEGLIPDLDLYFSDIAGYCSWGRKILHWPKEKVQEVKDGLGRSFFEKYPKYKPLEPMITESHTPDLHAKLRLYETMRTRLIELLNRILEVNL